MGLFAKSTRRNQDSDATTDGKEIPSWLKMLQDNSWELEILISGGAIFSLLQLSESTTGFFYQLAYTNDPIGRNVIFIFCMLAIKGITLGFFLHIIIRSFWVSLIALSSMYPISKDNDKIKYQKPFKHNGDKNLSHLIVKVDKIAGWMMYNSFTLLITIIGGMLLLMAGIFVTKLLEKIIPMDLSLVIAIPVCAYFFDLFTFSSLRKIPYLSYLLYPFFKVCDYISLRFIYQKGLDFVSQNISRWKVALYYFLFICSAAFFTYLSIQRLMHWPNAFDSRDYRFSLTKSEEKYTEFLYRNKTEDGRSHQASIQSDIISDPVINLFINYSIVYDRYIDQIKDPNEKYFENIWDITVDDSSYTNLTFYTIHGNNSTTMGITTYIDVGNFKQGPHILTIINKFEDADSKRKKLRIPFWLDKESDQ